MHFMLNDDRVEVLESRTTFHYKAASETTVLVAYMDRDGEFQRLPLEALTPYSKWPRRVH